MRIQITVYDKGLIEMWKIYRNSIHQVISFKNYRTAKNAKVYKEWRQYQIEATIHYDSNFKGQKQLIMIRSDECIELPNKPEKS